MAAESVKLCHLDDQGTFERLREAIEARHMGLRLGCLAVSGEYAVCAEHSGTRVYWIYGGRGEVLLPAGFRTKEGDGQPLPHTYVPEPIEAGLRACLDLIRDRAVTLSPSAQGPVHAILNRRHNGSYVGDFANELWKLEHTPEAWSCEERVNDAIRALYRMYRGAGYSVKGETSYEPIMAGDQLVVAGDEELRVRGEFACLWMERADRPVRHVPQAARLRYLKDSSGGCNFDFDPFRRLPLTWQMNLPGESGDGVNFVNSHVVNIPQETSPAHFHPSVARGGGAPQHEMYLVLDPKQYGLNTYGRRAHMLAFPDLRDLANCQVYDLEPASFVYIPAGIGHRGMDVFANVITLPGFKPHNEFYLDRDIYEATGGKAPCNESLFGIKNYNNIEELI